MTAITTTDLVLAERRGAVLVLTLNRPERLNAWTDALEERYYALPRRRRGRPRGARHRRHGRRPRLLRRRRPERPRARRDDRRRRGRAARPSAAAHFPLTVRKPMIAAINGAAAGLGLVEALYCDIRFATPRRQAHDRLRAARAGRRVRHLVAAAAARRPSAALDLLLSGRVVRGEEALRLGLVDRLSEPERVVDDAVAYAAGPRRPQLAVVDGHDQGSGPG